MVFRIVIAGEAQCELFAQTCVIADYLAQNLPNFCYERIEKSVLEWKAWLCTVNQKNKWHHCSSPLIWKELLMKGSSPYYIGSAPEFWEYCYSYYKLDTFLSKEKFGTLVKGINQFKKRFKSEIDSNLQIKQDLQPVDKSNFIICICGAGFPLTMNLISGLLDMSLGSKYISKIYLYDEECSKAFMEFVERECSYIESNNPTKVVKYVEKLGIALTQSDLLIVMDHVPLDPDVSIGEWLSANKNLMRNLADVINASACPEMRIIIPNLGPACYNATELYKAVNHNAKNYIVVATSDLGLEIVSTAAEIAGVPHKNMFCPPVWGFVGINHLVDVNTAYHCYNSFEPYNRYTKVRNSTLTVGQLTPNLRIMEYLMYLDETLWSKIAKRNKNILDGQMSLAKAEAVLNIVDLWLLDPNHKNIVSMGVVCDGSFDLTFKGIFSQPSRCVNGQWVPASKYMTPKDRHMKLSYLNNMAEIVLNMDNNALPKIIPYFPCTCKPKFQKKKQVWF